MRQSKNTKFTPVPEKKAKAAQASRKNRKPSPKSANEMKLPRMKPKNRFCLQRIFSFVGQGYRRDASNSKMEMEMCFSGVRFSELQPNGGTRGNGDFVR